MKINIHVLLPLTTLSGTFFFFECVEMLSLPDKILKEKQFVVSTIHLNIIQLITFGSKERAQAQFKQSKMKTRTT